MDEPNLKNISDYDNLEGEKRRVVIAVILATLVIGTIYTIAYNVYAQPEDKIEVQDRLHQIPLR